MSTDYLAKLQSLRKSHATEEAEAIEGVKGELLAAFTRAEKYYAALGSVLGDELSALYELKPFEKVFAKLGLKPVDAPKRKTKKSRAGRSKVTDEQLIEFLKDEKTTGQVQANFKLSPVTTGKKLGALQKARKVSVRKEGTKKFWKQS